ncbi:MAG: helix-turn-helix transcriptional regulator [Thiomargarita sp.]|nr:helix-turn-helix transcriptional regulator [Thiomargarita sp.]
MKTFKNHLKVELKNPEFKNKFLKQKQILKLGEKIKNARIKNGYTQAQLSEIAHITQQQLSKVEHGINYNIDTMLKVLNALKIELSFSQHL